MATRNDTLAAAEMKQRLTLLSLEEKLTEHLSTTLESCDARLYPLQCDDCDPLELSNVPYNDIESFRTLIAEGRYISRRIPWGRNAIANRRNYIVGKGIKYKVNLRDADDADADDSKLRVSEFLEEWAERNKWHSRQKKRCEMLDETGNALIRYAFPDDGYMTVRWVMPEQLQVDPKGLGTTTDYDDYERTTADYFENHGVRTSEDDIEDVQAYYLQGEGWVEASTIQHTKRNVTDDHPLGIPTLWAVKRYLEHADSIESGIAKLAEFHATFGAIRTVKGARSAEAIFAYATNHEADKGNTAAPEKYNVGGPATVTVPESVTYDFPDAGNTIPNLIKAGENTLRTVAAGLVMPEYMLSSDARNNNRASSETAGEPSWKEFESLQDEFAAEDLETVLTALRHAVDMGVITRSGTLTRNDLEAVTVTPDTPQIRTRNRRDEHQRFKDLWDRAVMSTETWQSKTDLDPKQESLGTMVDVPMGSDKEADAKKPEPPAPTPAAAPAAAPAAVPV